MNVILKKYFYGCVQDLQVPFLVKNEKKGIFYNLDLVQMHFRVPAGFWSGFGPGRALMKSWISGFGPTKKSSGRAGYSGFLKPGVPLIVMV